MRYWFLVDIPPQSDKNGKNNAIKNMSKKLLVFGKKKVFF